MDRNGPIGAKGMSMFDMEYIGSPEERLLAELHASTRAFDDAQWPTMLAAFAVCPDLQQIGTSNPALAFMLANYRAFVLEEIDDPWQPVARRLGLRRRALLEWLGWNEAHESHVRLVSKVTMPGITVEDMRSLRTVCGDRDALKLLQHLPSITAEVIRITGNPLARPVVTHSFLEDVATLDAETPASKFLDESIRLCGLHGGKLKRFHDYGQLELRYHFLLDAEYGVIADWDPQYDGVVLELPPTAPTVPRFTQPTGVHIEEFRSARDLYEWAKEERNCAFSMIEDVLGKRMVLFKVFEPVRGTLSLVPREDTWMIDDFKAARNRPIARDALWAVAAYLNKRLERVELDRAPEDMDGSPDCKRKNA